MALVADSLLQGSTGPVGWTEHHPDVLGPPSLVPTVVRRLQAHGHQFHMLVYPTLPAMVAAANRFNGNVHHGSLAVTQAYEYPDGRLLPIARFARNHVTTEVVIHEASHVATGLYATIHPKGEDALTHHNEALAHLTSRVAMSMLASLDRAGLL